MVHVEGAWEGAVTVMMVILSEVMLVAFPSHPSPPPFSFAFFLFILEAS